MKRIIIVLTLLCLINSCDREVSISQPLPDPIYGTLYVNSKPEGATIFLNGRNMGKTTPDTIKWLPFGGYKLELKKELYYVLEDSIYIGSEDISKFDYDYFSNPKVYGKFKIDSYPEDGADIIINGEMTDHKSPYLFTNMLPGRYVIKCFLPEFRSDSLIFNLSSSETKSLIVNIDDTSKIIKFNQKITGKKVDFIKKLRFMENDKLWINSENDGVLSFEKNALLKLTNENTTLPGEGISDFLLDEAGKTWFATGVGIATNFNNEWDFYNTSNSNLPSNAIFCISTDYNGIFWFGTDNGLVKFDRNNNNWTVYNKSNSKIPANLITAVSCDAEGNVYIGTNGLGAAKFDGTDWIRFTKTNSGLSTNYINLVQAVGGSVLIACLNEPGSAANIPGGLFRLSNGSIRQIYTPKASSRMYDINLIGSDIWVSTGRCAFRMDREFNRMEILDWSVVRELPTNSIVSLDIDSFGNKWIGTWGHGFIKIK